MCIMPGQQVSCKGGERSVDLGHEKTPRMIVRGVVEKLRTIRKAHSH